MGTISSGSVVMTEDSIVMSQLKDVVITPPGHDQSIKYDSISSNWVNSGMFTLQELGDMNINSVVHNDVLIWNSTTNYWENGKLASLLTTLEAVVSGIVSIKLSIYIGEIGDSAKSISVAFTDNVENEFTLAMASCADNNAVYKKEPSSFDFTFLTTLSRGEIYHDNLPAGTVFRSEKGLAGCSSPFPMPFGVSCLAATYFRFYAFRLDVYVFVTSAGRDSLVTLYASDESRIVDGPKFISAYGSAEFHCDANTEFVIVSTTDVFCGTGTINTNTTSLLKTIDVRLIPPMRCELIVHNRGNRVTAQETGTSVTWYRQNMEQDSVTINAGTPLTIGNNALAGTDEDYANQGWLILRSSAPISSFSGADGSGGCATEGWPIEFLSQMFPIYATLSGTHTRFDQCGINICSPYEGECRIYDSSGTLVFTFPYTRGTTPPATPEDQMYPAAGQSNPATDGYAALVGGWVETTTPSVCVINFIGTATGSFGQSDGGDETTIPGTTPDEIRAVIRKDPDGFLRRRDIDVTTGNETWNIC